MTASPRLVIISAPSGAGKTTLTHRLLELYGDRFDLSVSATTRKPRSGEETGRAYHFVSPAEFERWKQEGRFLETAQYAGEWYGTLLSEVNRILGSGKHVLLDIEVVGADEIRRKWPGEPPIRIFVLPATPEVLIQRLLGRRTETPDQLAARLSLALSEMHWAADYDRLVRNDDLDKAATTIAGIVAEGGGRRHQRAELDWIEQFGTGLQREKARLYSESKGTS